MQNAQSIKLFMFVLCVCVFSEAYNILGAMKAKFAIVHFILIFNRYRLLQLTRFSTSATVITTTVCVIEQTQIRERTLIRARTHSCRAQWSNLYNFSVLLLYFIVTMCSCVMVFACCWDFFIYSYYSCRFDY